MLGAARGLEDLGGGLESGRGCLLGPCRVALLALLSLPARFSRVRALGKEGFPATPPRRPRSRLLAVAQARLRGPGLVSVRWYLHGIPLLREDVLAGVLGARRGTTRHPPRGLRRHALRRGSVVRSGGLELRLYRRQLLVAALAHRDQAAPLQ